MLMSYKRGQTSVVLRVKILDSSVSTGAGKTGLAYNTSGLIISTIADNESTATAYTVAGSTIETISTLGTYAAPTSTKCRFKEVDSTNHKGVYEIQIADARFAVSSAKSLIVSISGATNAAETDVVIPLQDMDPYDAVRGGMTALPNANAAASNGLLTSGTGSNQITTSSGAVTVGTINSGVAAADVWNATRSSYTTAGSFGQGVASVQGAVTGNVGGSVGSISGVSFPSNFNLIAIDGSGRTQIQVGTSAGQLNSSGGKVPATLASTDVTGNITAQVNAYNTGQDPATLVLDATASGHNTAGTIGAKINAAGSSSDPLANAGSTYSTPGTIGYIINTNINATVTSRLASGNVTVGGYASGQDPATSILVTPANKIVTDSSGRMQVQSGTGTGQILLNAGLVSHDLTQAVPTSNTAQTVGDAYNAARAQGFGKWVLSGTTMNLYGPDGSTVVRTFTLDSASTPTQRS